MPTTDLLDNSFLVLQQFDLSVDRLTAFATSRDGTIHSEIHHSTGKWYFEWSCPPAPADLAWGLCTLNQDPATGASWNTGFSMRRYFNSWWYFPNGTQVGTGNAGVPISTTLGFAVDFDNTLIWYRDLAAPTVWYGNNATGDPVAGTNGFNFSVAFNGGPIPELYPCFSAISQDQSTYNAGATPFVAVAPVGFDAWDDTTVAGPFVREVQLPREILHKPNPMARVAFLSREVLDNFDPNMRIPFTAREVLRSRPTGLYIALQTDMAELWFMPGTFIDFSIESNRRKFHSAAHKTISLGADGSAPTGTTPLIYLSLGASDDNANDFVDNATGGDPMTLVTVDGKGRGYGKAPTDPSA